MKLKDAVSKAREKKEIKDLIEGGGFFCSGFVTIDSEEKIEKWNLSFYDPNKGKITSVLVREGSVEIGLTDKPLHKKVYNPDESNIKISGEEALEKAKKEFNGYGKPLAKILISFQKKEKEFWNVSFITKLGSIVNVKVDPQSGGIVSSEEINLFHKYQAV